MGCREILLSVSVFTPMRGQHPIQEKTMADKPKVKPVCKACGSDEISCDATARWDIDIQNWELSGTFDSKTCDQCGYEKDYCDWITINDERTTHSGTP